MRSFNKFLSCIFLSGIVLFLLNNCARRPERSMTEPKYIETVMNRGEFENSVKISPPQKINKAGKIYLKDNYIFIGDTNKGFHIFDNSNPGTPLAIGFIEMPGVTDIAIREDVFYANQAVDLVTFKLKMETKEVEVLKRIRNTFPALVSPDGIHAFSDSTQVVVDWNLIKKES